MKGKKWLALLLALTLLAALMIPTVYAADKVIHISTAEELRELSENCRLDTYSKDLTVYLENDIDLGGEPFEPIATFGGTFEGNTYTISGFVPATDGAHQGFFRYIQPEGTVRSLYVEGRVNPSNIRTEVGGLVGTNFGTVTSCTFTGEVRGLERVGGLVGENDGVVRNCEFYGTVAGKRFTGGIVGYNTGSMERCVNFGEVNTSIETTSVSLDDITIADLTSIAVVTAEDSDTVTDTGGVVGLSEGIIDRCTNYGVIGYQHFGYNVGGIAGRHCGYITECENYGSVCGRKDIGGIVGQMEPFMLLTATDSLIEELNLFNEAMTNAMNNLSANASRTHGVMSDISKDAKGAKDNAIIMNENADNPLVDPELVSEVTGEGGEQQEGVDWGHVGEVAGDITGGIAETGIGIAEGAVEGDAQGAAEAGIEGAGKGIDAIKEKAEQRKAEDAARQQKYDSAYNGLSVNMGNMSNNIARLNEALTVSTQTLASDMQEVNYHFYKMTSILANVLSGNYTIFEDLSEDDTDEHTDGKVIACVNEGVVDGDLGIGGISGDMGIELEYDLEGVISDELNDLELVSNTYEARCVARECVNNGTVNGKKEHIGGVVGYQELGMVVGCEAYGDVSGAEASYVGGVAGLAQTVIRESYSMCSVEGFKFVGGIAGEACEMQNCAAITEVKGTASVGAIAGNVQDLAAEGAVIGNRFCSNELGGIDGISYGGMAEPVADVVLQSDPNVPDNFRRLTITFMADGQLVAECIALYSEGLAPEDIPAVPAKAHYTGYWPDFDFDNIRSAATLEAYYNPNQTSLASPAREGELASIILLEGDFDDCASLTLTPIDENGPVIEDAATRETWFYRVDDNRDTEGMHTVHYLPPELLEKRDVLTVYELQGDSWVRLNTKNSGSYLVFENDGSTGIFSVVEFAGTLVSPVLIVLLAVLLFLAALYFMLRRLHVDLSGIKGFFSRFIKKPEGLHCCKKKKAPAEDPVEEKETADLK